MREKMDKRQLREEELIDGTGPVNDCGNRTNRHTQMWWVMERVLREDEKVREEGLERMRRHGERYGEKGWDPAAAPVAEPPRVMGHVPEIVVTPTPAPSKP